jgi:hypothetical protein
MDQEAGKLSNASRRVFRFPRIHFFLIVHMPFTLVTHVC